MFIATEKTPNPNTIKFLPGQTVMERGVAEFKTLEGTGVSMLAQKMMGLDGVTSVFFGRDFISVSKKDAEEWEALQTRILAAIMDHYTTGLTLFREGMAPWEQGKSGSSAVHNEEDDELTKQIKELLETRVSPMVAQDGGDIVFDRFEQGVVYLEMRGACAGCPSSTMTLKSGIENMLRHYVPEVLEVRPTSDY